VELRVVEVEAGGSAAMVELSTGGSDVVTITWPAVAMVGPDVESDVAGTTTVVT
jgi:hypothetical protein